MDEDGITPSEMLLVSLRLAALGLALIDALLIVADYYAN